MVLKTLILNCLSMSLWFHRGLSLSNSFALCPILLERLRSCLPFDLMSAPRYLQADLMGIRVPSRKEIGEYETAVNFMCLPCAVTIPGVSVFLRPSSVEAISGVLSVISSVCLGGTNA